MSHEPLQAGSAPIATPLTGASLLVAALEDLGVEGVLATNGPAMLEVMTDIEEAIYPIVPAGKGYHDMNLGPYIHEVETAEAPGGAMQKGTA
jgi:hypothetical protein